MTPGFIAWALHASQHFVLVIYSSRSKEPDGINAMRDWLGKQLAERFMPHEVDEILALFQFAHEKPAAWLTIDDRCVRFDGKWDAAELQPDALMEFEPWMHRAPPAEPAP